MTPPDAAHDTPALPRITGSTLLVAGIGDPVAQMRAPAVFNRMFEALNADAVCIPMHVPPATLATTMALVRALPNLIGLSVTIPHKASVIPYLDEISPRARQQGVCNAVRREKDGRLVGDIFDGEGFVGGLAAQGHTVKGARAWLVGAGGAGTAISFSLLEHGLAQLTLFDVDRAKAEALAAKLSRHFPGRVMVGADDAPEFAINATPLGMKPDDPLPFDPRRLPKTTVIAEVIMKPPVTRLLATAEANGQTIHHGRHMLDHQVELYAEFLGFRSLPKRSA